MTSTRPDVWDVANALMANVREAQNRAESDTLRFVVVAVAFLIVRASAASAITFGGFTIANPRVVQFALVPYAAFLAIRYTKATRLVDRIVDRLSVVLEDISPPLPLEAFPVDWDNVRNGSNVTRVSLERARWFFPAVMGVAVLIGLGLSWYDASESDYIWIILATLATLGVVLAIATFHKAWSKSFLGPRSIDTDVT